MQFVYEQPELEKAIADARTIEEIEAAMQRIAGLVSTFASPELRGAKMFSPGLDQAVVRVATKLGLKDVQIEKSNDNVCVLATRFYGTGGHSKVASDICRLVGADRVTIIFTDLYRQLRTQALLSGIPRDYPARSLMLLSAPTMAEKVIELYMLLAAIRPSRIFLLQNHMDIVATAGAWPFRGVTEFVHHADHLPALGATLPFSAHADLTYTCHLACRELDVNAAYVGMSVQQDDTVETPAVAAAPGGRVRLATCGALHKYRHAARYRWTDFVVAALRDRDAEFLHIGPSQPDFEQEVRAALELAGIAPDRYVFLGARPNLRELLVSEGVDVYVAGYPEGGGRATLEAMSAGIATIQPTADELPPLLHFSLPLDGWLRITTPEEMPQAVDRGLAMKPDMVGPRFRGELKREFERFDDYVRMAG